MLGNVIPILQMRKVGVGRLTNLPEVAELVNGGAEMQFQ